MQTKKLTNPKEFVWVLMISRVSFQVGGQLRAIAVMNLHLEPPRATRHRLPYFARSNNPQDFAAYLTAQHHLGTSGPPSPCPAEFLRLVRSTRSPQEKQHGDVRRRIAVDTWCICDRNLPLHCPLQVDVLKSHRIGGNDSYCWRNSLEEDGIQTVQGSDEYSVSPVCRCQQLLSAERSRIRIAPWLVIPIDAVFNFLRKLAGDNQNWFLHFDISDFGTSIEAAVNTMPALPAGLLLRYSYLVRVGHAKQAA